MRLSEIHLRDPFILPDHGVYYLYGTGRANHRCGFDVYTSRDLIEWSQPQTVFDPAPDFWGTEDFWAPEVHLYEGKYYLFASFKSPAHCRGTAILVSDSPAGPFVPHSDGAVTPQDWECLDGTFYVDDEHQPWMIFCHEWVQIQDGTVCAIKLSADLRQAISEPILLWHATDAPWIHWSCKPDHFVTDGPFLFRQGEALFCLWSSFDQNGYVEALAVSPNGQVTGPWSVDLPPLLCGHDGGHGMLFTTFDGMQKFVCHRPNLSPTERPVLYDFDSQRSLH